MGEVTFRIEPVDGGAVFSMYNWEVTMAPAGEPPMSASGRASSFAAAGRMVRCRVRRRLGWWRYWKVRRLLP